MPTEPSTVELGPGTEIARRDEILNPMTGELVAWDDPGGVAVVLKALRDHKDEVHAAIRVCEAALIDESERRGMRTMRVGGPVQVVRIAGGSALDWDVTILDELVGAGLPEERFAELVSIEQKYKVNAAVAKQIEGSNPVYAEIIGRARSRVPTRRHVSV